MGLSDFFSDLYSSLTIQPVYAEEPNAQPSGELNDGSTTTGEYGGMHTAQQRGQATVRGGASTQGSPATGSDEETPGEKEANKQDVKTGGESDEPGHKPGAGGEGSGQVGPAPGTGSKGGDDEAEEGGEEEEKGEKQEGGDEEDEEEEEEEEEPEDLMPKLHEGSHAVFELDAVLLNADAALIEFTDADAPHRL
ncbi:MAG: hypothetical protein Q9165_000545 [Trypethelium subeluteriae]